MRADMVVLLPPVPDHFFASSNVVKISLSISSSRSFPQNTFGNTYYESIRHLEASHRTTYTVAALPGTFRFVGLA